MSQPKASSHNAGLLLCGLLLGLCVTGLFFAGKWLAAAWYAGKVEDQIDLWQSYGDIYFLEEWEQALADVTRAVALQESNAEWHSLQGFIYEWRRVAPYPEDDSLNPMQALRRTIQVQAEARQHALASYRRALTLRPAWPPDWIKVAYLKGLSEEFDDEFYNAVAQSYRLGQNLGFVQDDLLDVTLRFYEEIQGEQQTREMQMAWLGKRLNQGNIGGSLAMINRFRLMGEVCKELIDRGVGLAGSVERACEETLGEE